MSLLKLAGNLRGFMEGLNKFQKNSFKKGLLSPPTNRELLQAFRPDIVDDFVGQIRRGATGEKAPEKWLVKSLYGKGDGGIKQWAKESPYNLGGIGRNISITRHKRGLAREVTHEYARRYAPISRLKYFSKRWE